MRWFTALAVGSTILCGAWSNTTTGDGGSMATGSAGQTGATQAVPSSLPICSSPLGTVALVESNSPALAQAGLSSPVPVLRLLISQSRCFIVVDRGQALTRIQEEMAISGGSGVGRGSRMVQAQYFLTPNILFQENNTGGGGGGLGSFVPGILGAIGGAVGFDDSAAQSVLELTETSTGLQKAVATGSAKTRDWKLAGFGVGGGAGGFGGSYASTPLGKTVVAALLDSYSQLVRQLQGM